MSFVFISAAALRCASLFQLALVVACRFSFVLDNTMKPLRIGIIGYGFMGRTHSNAFKQVSQFFDLEYRPVLKAVCARDAGKAKAFAQQWGYESVETDWRKLVERDDIDVIDIAAPNNVHAEIA